MRIKWLKDFEKRFLIFMLIGFWWAVCWVIITALVKIWMGLPSDNPIMFFLGGVMLVGFVYFQSWGICILTKGLFLDIKKQIKNGNSSGNNQLKIME